MGGMHDPEEGEKGTGGKAVDDDTALGECKRGLKGRRKEDRMSVIGRYGVSLSCCVGGGRRVGCFLGNEVDVVACKEVLSIASMRYFG